MSSLSVQPLLAFNNMDNECSIDDKLDRILQDERAEPCSIPLQYLRDITANFSADRELGNGGFGVVYKVRSNNILSLIYDTHTISLSLSL